VFEMLDVLIRMYQRGTTICDPIFAVRERGK